MSSKEARPAFPLEGALTVAVGLFALFTPVSIAGAHISLGLAGLLLLAHGPSRAFAARLARTHFLRVPVLLWCAACVVAALFAEDRAQSVGKLDKLLLLSLLALGALPSVRAALPRVLAVLVGSATIVSVYGLAAHVLAGGGLLARVRGISGFYLTVAGILMVVALLTLSIALALARSRERGRGRRDAALLAAAALAIVAALGGTYARGSWLGFVAGALFLARRRRVLLGGLAAALVIGYAAAPAPLKERVGSTFDPRHRLNQERLLIWRHGLSIVAEKPWTGVGQVVPDSLMRREVMTPDGPIRIHSHMHNVYLQIAASMGIPALAVFVFLIASFFRLGRRAARAAPRSAWEAGLTAAYPAILIALLVNGLVEWNFGDSEILGLFYLISGFVLGIEAAARPSAETGA